MQHIFNSLAFPCFTICTPDIGESDCQKGSNTAGSSQGFIDDDQYNECFASEPIFGHLPGKPGEDPKVFRKGDFWCETTDEIEERCFVNEVERALNAFGQVPHSNILLLNKVRSKGPRSAHHLLKDRTTLTRILSSLNSRLSSQGLRTRAENVADSIWGLNKSGPVKGDLLDVPRKILANDCYTFVDLIIVNGYYLMFKGLVAHTNSFTLLGKEIAYGDCTIVIRGLSALRNLFPVVYAGPSRVFVEENRPIPDIPIKKNDRKPRPMNSFKDILSPYNTIDWDMDSNSDFNVDSESSDELYKPQVTNYRDDEFYRYLIDNNAPLKHLVSSNDPLAQFCVFNEGTNKEFFNTFCIRNKAFDQTIDAFLEKGTTPTDKDTVSFLEMLSTFREEQGVLLKEYLQRQKLLVDLLVLYSQVQLPHNNLKEVANNSIHLAQNIKCLSEYFSFVVAAEEERFTSLSWGLCKSDLNACEECSHPHKAYMPDDEATMDIQDIKMSNDYYLTRPPNENSHIQSTSGHSSLEAVEVLANIVRLRGLSILTCYWRLNLWCSSMWDKKREPSAEGSKGFQCYICRRTVGATGDNADKEAQSSDAELDTTLPTDEPTSKEESSPLSPTIAVVGPEVDAALGNTLDPDFNDPLDTTAAGDKGDEENSTTNPEVLTTKDEMRTEEDTENEHENSGSKSDSENNSGKGSPGSIGGDSKGGSPPDPSSIECKASSPNGTSPSAGGNRNGDYIIVFAVSSMVSFFAVIKIIKVVGKTVN